MFWYRSIVNLSGGQKNLINPALLEHIGNTDGNTHPNNDIDIVKTHELNIDENKSIYIARDGRSSVVSYMHFLQSFEGSNIDLPKIIAGMAWPSSWAEHVRSWDPINRPNTLLVKYEDMVSDVNVVIEKVGSFIGAEKLRGFDIKFDVLHQHAPLFFRSGNNEDAIKEISPHIDLFDRYNGDMMKYMGYY